MQDQLNRSKREIQNIENFLGNLSTAINTLELESNSPEKDASRKVALAAGRFKAY